MPSKKQPPLQTTISGCTFTAGGPPNEHTRAAVEALARAAEENARAIREVALALRGATGLDCMLKIGG